MGLQNRTWFMMQMSTTVSISVQVPQGHTWAMAVRREVLPARRRRGGLEGRLAGRRHRAGGRKGATDACKTLLRGWMCWLLGSCLVRTNDAAISRCALHLCICSRC